MPKPCKECIETQPHHAPMHLVHPERRVPNLYDIFGEAVCPTCGTLWRRSLNVSVMVTRERKPPKRVAASQTATTPRPAQA